MPERSSSSLRRRAETRFDAAYKAIMQSALAALMMHGYRPDTKQLGHHSTDGEDGYRLTRPGVVFLAACSLRPKRMEPTLGNK